MPRPKSPRTILSHPKVTFYKPHGICLQDLEVVTLGNDEFEAIKLHDYDQLSHIEAAKAMNVSQPTFGRILNSSYQKISQALLQGKAIAIQTENEKGKAYETTHVQAYFDTTHAVCDVCGRPCLA